MKRKILLLALLAASAVQAEPNPQQLERCQYGVMLAQRAYLSGVFDAQRYNDAALTYLVDYWGEQFIVQYDREVAMRGVRYVAKRFKDAGIRRPTEQLMYEPIQEVLFNECYQYTENQK